LQKRIFEYRVSLVAPGPASIVVVEEELTRIDDGNRTCILQKRRSDEAWTFLNEKSNQSEQLNSSPDQLGIMLLRDSLAHKSIQDFRKTLGSCLFFDLQPQLMRSASPIAPNPVLTTDGSNVASVLDAMHGEEPIRFSKFEQDLFRIVPEIQSVRFKSVQNGSKFMAFRESSLPTETYSFQASDGMLRAAAMLAALHSSQAALLAIEEPENGLHPRRLEQFIEVFRDYTRTQPNLLQKQIVATCHSTNILNWIEPEELLIASRNDGGTSFSHVIDIARVRSLMEDAPLGDLWYRGSLGGVPSP
jgi:predicted ATPase